MTESPQTDMQDAFQAFMLGHTGKKKKKNSTNNSSPKKQSTPKPSTPKPPTTPIKESPSRKQQQRSFQNLIQEWTETDDTLYALVCSVTDMRQRLYYTVLEQQRCITQQKVNDNDEWKSAGFRPSLNKDPSSSWLQPHDYDVALDHILLQHEKALQNIRRLLGQQSQTMDSMGRRLEFLLMEDSLDCQDSFRHLARELYRKQVLAQRLFASVQDNLWSSLEPWEIARAGQKEWRGSLSS